MNRPLTVSLVCCLLLISGCQTNPSTGRSQLILPQFTTATVAAMGEEAAPQLVAEYGGEVTSNELRNYVRGVGTKLLRHVEPEYKGLNWEFFTLNSNVINAFALPGGKVFITRGLLSHFDNEAQVAGVLGHEIGHVTARHVDERLSQATTAEIISQGLQGVTDSELISLSTNLLAQGTLLHFSRSQESEADAQGLKYMTAAGYDPQGMIEVIEVLMKASEGSGQLEILSTHPSPETRFDRVTEQIENEYAYTQGNPDYDENKGRFQRLAAPHLGGQ